MYLNNIENERNYRRLSTIWIVDSYYIDSLYDYAHLLLPGFEWGILKNSNQNERKQSKAECLKIKEKSLNSNSTT